MTKVFLVCSGLGRISRGYEVFAQECFNALTDASTLDMMLFKGGGRPGKKQIVLWNAPRHARFWGWLSQKVGKDGYWIEQVTFTLSLLWHIARQKPDVIYFSDCSVGNMLWHLRRRTKQKFKLLFCNGGPLPPPFPRWDYVQQVAPVHSEAALAAGQDPARQQVLPLGIRMDAELPVLSDEERRELKSALGLPVDRPIVLSVGAVISGHKRMDYVVREVASLPEPRPFLAIIGDQDERANEIRAAAEALLGADGYQINTVPHADVAKYYQCADVFVLASLFEGFGIVFLEAMSHGLITLAHDYGVTRYVLGSTGILSDLAKPGSLAALIPTALQQSEDVTARRSRHREVLERFSWQYLVNPYIDMIELCAAT